MPIVIELQKYQLLMRLHEQIIRYIRPNLLVPRLASLREKHYEQPLGYQLPGLKLAMLWQLYKLRAGVPSIVSALVRLRSWVRVSFNFFARNDDLLRYNLILTG